MRKNESVIIKNAKVTKANDDGSFDVVADSVETRCYDTVSAMAEDNDQIAQIAGISQKRKYEISLNDVTGLKVTDVYGYVSEEFGDKIFKITRIQLGDGSTLDVEGEHDLPYIAEELNLP